MPDLINDLLHKRNTKVYVDGTIYKIDADGICRDVDPDHAEVLLGGKAWHVWDGTDPKEILAAQKADRLQKAKADHQQAVQKNLDKMIEEKVRAEVKRRMLEDGWRPPGPKSTPETPKKAPETAPATPQASAEPKSAPKVAEEAPEPAEAKSEAQARDEDGVEDPPIPEGEGVEWPDPDPRYSLEWLKACADAYEVTYPANIGAAKLCDKIKAAMYE